MSSGPGSGIGEGANRLNRRHFVCLLESDEVLVELERWALTQRGYEVTAFTEPSEYLRWIATCDPPPDLMISDYALPSVTGLELLGRLKTAFPQVKTLLTSGYAASELGDLKSVDAFLPKPFTTDHLLTVVSELLASTP